MFVACLFQNSWRGLAGLSPSAFSEGVRKLTASTNRAVFQHINKKAVQKHVGEGWGGSEGWGEGGEGGEGWDGEAGLDHFAQAR